MRIVDWSSDVCSSDLAAARPDLRFVGLRGNMATRLAKAAGHDAIVVAAAALDRLGLAHEIAERLPVELVLPQVGQAALAVECRVDDRELLERLAAVDHRSEEQTSELQSLMRT